MDEHQFIECLIHYGLTRQEAIVYHRLLTDGKQTGYEIAKATGISRSNAYSALAALTEKGAAYILEENAKKYIPVALEEFCENSIRRMQEEKAWMLKNLPSSSVDEEGYITIEGETNISNKIHNLLNETEERVYLSCSYLYLSEFQEELMKLEQQGKKVVIITDGICPLENVQVYTGDAKGKQIGIITDSKHVLTGEYGTGSMNTCLYSGKKNFVMLYKNALANEIKLMTLSKEKQ